MPDFLGGVADVVSGAGDSKASYDYDPFGNARTDGTASGTSTVDNPIRFTGHYQDAGLGDQYSTLARVYDPATGRFGGVDPAAAPLNTPATSSYAYVGSKPTVYTDPSGAVAETCAGMGGNNDHGDAVDVMNVVHAAAHGTGRTVVTVLHDLTLAAQYADHLVVMGEGQIAAQGRPADVLTEELLANVFGLRAKVVEVGGAPVVVPDRRLTA